MRDAEFLQKERESRAQEAHGAVNARLTEEIDIRRFS